MKEKHQQVDRTAASIEEFMRVNARAVPRAAASGVRTDLLAQANVLRESMRQQGTQGDQSLSASSLKEALREALFRDHLRPVVAIANVVLADQDGFRPIALPIQSLGMSKLDAGVTIVGKLQPHESLFAGWDFASRLSATRSAADDAAPTAEEVTAQTA